jgi:2-iminobutanoate/2-iminopropanoate deaminase
MERKPGASGNTLSDFVKVELSSASSWVYVSGQVSRSPDRVRQTLSEQAGTCFEQIDALLHEAGGSLADVVRITAFVTTLEGYPEYNRVRGEFFHAGLPASATVQVAGLLGEGTLIEIDAVACLARRI